VVNTVQLPDKTWFIIQLVMGMLGFIAMVLYIIAGSNSPSPAGSQRPVPAGPGTGQRERVDGPGNRRAKAGQTTAGREAARTGVATNEAGSQRPDVDRT
jgi:hypothetical protein